MTVMSSAKYVGQRLTQTDNIYRVRQQKLELAGKHIPSLRSFSVQLAFNWNLRKTTPKTTSLLQQFIHDNPLGILTTAIKSTEYPLHQSSHISFILDIPSPNDASTPGILRGHIVKQNHQAKALIEALAQQQSQDPAATTLELPDEFLILFNDPYHHYVAPKFYTETKSATGKVEPTWNYTAVQVYGKIKVYCDPSAAETGAFLHRQVEDLSRHAETRVMGLYWWPAAECLEVG